MKNGQFQIITQKPIQNAHSKQEFSVHKTFVKIQKPWNLSPQQQLTTSSPLNTYHFRTEKFQIRNLQ